jgi:hypothetical protein
MTDRRTVLRMAATGAVGTILAGGLRGMSAFAANSAGGTRVPTITGPVTGGQHGWAFGAYYGNIGDIGYSENEYFIAGMAERYQPVGTRTNDGKWTVKVVGSAPYKTRIIVQRPIEPAKFNGIVIVDWTNAAAGYDNFGATPIMHEMGFAYVAVTTLKPSVHGFATNPAGLLQWDPERYGSLSIPGESLSYDIFTQAARAVGAKRLLHGVDPLGGLKVRRIIGIGASQSGSRLMAYLNAIQPREGIFDGLMPTVCGGTNAYFGDDGPDTPPTGTPADQARYIPARVREDLNAKVMAINSETEAMSHHGVVQPDSDKFVYWEIAGGSHGGGGGDPSRALRIQRDKPLQRTSPGRGPAAAMPNRMNWGPVAEAGFVHFVNWVDGGKAPPSQEPMIVVSGTPPKFQRDQFGNAVGGVRLPDLEVPVARYAAYAESGAISGQTYPFAPDLLRQLYPTHDAYVAKVRAAAEAAAHAEVILPKRVADYVINAENAPIPA